MLCRGRSDQIALTCPAQRSFGQINDGANLGSWEAHMNRADRISSATFSDSAGLDVCPHLQLTY